MASAHLRKRGDKSWSIILELGEDPATGKRIQKWVTFHGTKRDAEVCKAELITDAERGQISASPKMTVADYLEHWLKDHAEPNTGPKTYYRYEGIIRNNIVPYLSELPLDHLRPAGVVTWQSRLRAAKRLDGKEDTLSPTTRKQTHAVLRRAMNDAVRWGLLPLSPVRNIKASRAAQAEMSTFSAEQTLTFFEALENDGPFWGTLFYVWMTSGIRLAEITGLRWQDVDLETRTIAVRQTIYRLARIGVVKKGAKSAPGRRPIALDDEAVALLRQHRADQDELRRRLGDAWHANDLVFPGATGDPHQDKPVRRVFRDACERAGLPRIRPHDLRHTSATLLLQAGVHPKVVSERLGHSNDNITLTIYSHVTQTLQEQAAAKLGEMLRRPSRPTDNASERSRNESNQ